MFEENAKGDNIRGRFLRNQRRARATSALYNAQKQQV